MISRPGAMTDDEGAGETRTDPGTGDADEDLIESDASSARSSEVRRRLARLVPASVSRKSLGGIAAAALTLGLVAGFLVGSTTEDGSGETASQPSTETGTSPEAEYLTIVPDGMPLEQEVIVFPVGAGYLRLEDLASLGETALPGGYIFDAYSGRNRNCGIAGSPDRPSVAQDEPGVRYDVLGSASFVLAGATLTEQIGPDLDVLAASTLRARVELAQSCTSEALTVSTDGIQAGIGDEYAVFSVGRPDPATGELRTGIVVLVRVGGHLIELSLTSLGDPDVPNGLARALRIAEVAVARMLAG